MGAGMVDLDRLRIPEQHQAPRRGAWKVVVLCLLFLGLGYGAAMLAAYLRQPASLRVQTTVARPPAGGAGRQFTAGGWIEVATPAYPIVVSSRISERLESLMIQEGQVVQPGDVVARMYDKDIRSRLGVDRARLEAAQKTLEKLEAGFRQEEVRAAEAKLAGADETVRIAKANYDRSRKLLPGAISPEELDKQLSALRSAEAERAEIQAEVDKLRAGSRKEDVAVARANVNEAAGLVELAEKQLSYCTIPAPDAKKPLRVLKVLHKVGDWIDAEKGTAIAWLYDPQDMQVRVDVTQSNINAVKVGSEVSVRTEAAPSRQYKGRVLRAEPLAELAKNTVTVRVRIEDPDLLLFPEMVAQVTFLGAPDEGGAPSAAGVLVPAAAVLKGEGGSYVFLSRDGQAVRQAVKVIEPLGQNALVEGVPSGSRVIVSPLQKVRDGQKVEEE